MVHEKNYLLQSNIKFKWYSMDAFCCLYSAVSKREIGILGLSDASGFVYSIVVDDVRGPQRNH